MNFNSIYTTIPEICEELNITRQTFYNRGFKSDSKLFEGSISAGLGGRIFIKRSNAKQFIKKIKNTPKKPRYNK